MKLCTSLILVNVLLGSGCRSIGPKKVTRDRVDHCHSLADSWKSQMLLNILEVRYLDLPIFLDSFTGLYNRPAMLSSKCQPDPEFFQVLTLVRDVQDTGALGMKVTEPEEGQSAMHTIS